MPLDEYKKNITAIVDQCQAAGVKVLIMTSTQIGLPVTNSNNTKLIGYNDFLHQLAAERHLPLADLNADMLAAEKADPDRGLTVDGVHMNIYGNLMMAKGILRTFGLDDAQIAKCDAAWLDIPDTYQTSVRAKLTLRELAKLEALAKAQKESAKQLVETISQKALDDTIQAAAKQ